MTAASTDALDRAIAEAVAAEPEILAGYVFGSRARGESRATSDLDVALLAVEDRALPIEVEDRLRRVIAKATSLRVDIARLGPSSPVLAYEVLSTGRRVFARDAEHVDEIEEGLLRRYLDTEHLRRVARAYLLETRS